MRRFDVDRHMRRESARPAVKPVSHEDFVPGRDGLSRPARAVYRVLLVCGKADSGTLQFETIGDGRFRRETGYGRTSVVAARKELVAAGLLEVLTTGSGRDRSAYRLVLESTAYERELYDLAHPEVAEAFAAAAGAEGLFPGPNSDTLGVKFRHPGGQISTPPTRARPGSSGFIRPYPSGPGPAAGDEAGLRPPEEPSPGAGAGAARCPTAASRGKPCGSCRACGTNPRALRQATAAAARRGSTGGLAAQLPPTDERDAIYQRGLAGARAVVEELARSKAASDQGRVGPPDPLSASGGAP